MKKIETGFDGLDHLRFMMNRKYEANIGDRIGRWTILDIVVHKWIKYGICRCECGQVKTVSRNSLRQGKSLSCGCFNMQVIAKNRTKHGFQKREDRHWVYARWRSMLSRCYNPNNFKYKNYGNRGITVCAQWHDFSGFIRDMGIPEKKLSLDRIDTNGNYEKENCKWSTPKEQSRNRTNNHIIEFRGERKCLSVWAETYNLNSNTIRARLKRGWNIEKAFTFKIKHNTRCQ